jgi:hypothetical protein
MHCRKLFARAANEQQLAVDRTPDVLDGTREKNGAHDPEEAAPTTLSGLTPLNIY